MSAYIPVELRRQIRHHFADCCAYCKTAESLTVAIFEVEHIQQDGWHEHFSWSSDATEIVGRTPTGRATIVALRMNRAQLVRVRRMWVAMGEHPPETDNR